MDQHTYAMDHIVRAAEFSVDLTEVDEVIRDVLCFLAADDKLPSVDAEGTFLAYGRDGRDVRVCVEVKILRRVLHAIDATSARWRGDAGFSPLGRARTAASSPRNDL